MRQIAQVRAKGLFFPFVIVYACTRNTVGTSVIGNMHENQGTKSEVAQIMAQIQAEYESSMCGLSGLASGTSRHEFITARMERIGQLHSDLRDLVGEQDATGLLVNALEKSND